MADKIQEFRVTQQPSARGLPPSSVTDDLAHLVAVSRLMASNPDLEPTTAIKTLGITDPSVIRRLRDKFSSTDAQLLTSTEITPVALGELGRTMSDKLMPEIAAKHPEDSVVMFLVETGAYITAVDDTALLDKYEALHHDEWGWVTDIVRGPSDKSESVGRP